MALPRRLVGEIRRLNDSQLRQLLILARGLLLDTEQPVIEITDIPGMPTVRYRQRSVSCGKATCGGCPHGPYWYAHWTEEGRRRSQYIGSELPTAIRRKLEVMDAAWSSQVVSGAREAPPQQAPRAATAGGLDGHSPPPRLRLLRGD